MAGRKGDDDWEDDREDERDYVLTDYTEMWEGEIYPTHEEIADYIEALAEAYGLDEHDLWELFMGYEGSD